MKWYNPMITMEYIYYRIFFQLKKVKTNDTPVFNALIFLIVFQALNIISVCGVINHYIKIYLFKNQILMIAIVFSLLLFILNFMYFFRNHKEIFKRYENETEKSKRRGIVYVLLYIIISVVFFFVIGETLII